MVPKGTTTAEGVMAKGGLCQWRQPREKLLTWEELLAQARAASASPASGLTLVKGTHGL